MTHLYEKILEGGDDISTRVIVRRTARAVGLQSEALLYLFYGDVPFRSRQFAKALDASLGNFIESQGTSDMEVFMDFYKLTLQKRQDRLRRAKVTDSTATVLCRPSSWFESMPKYLRQRLKFQRRDVDAVCTRRK